MVVRRSPTVRTSICLLRLRGARWLLLCAVFVVAGGCGAKVIRLKTDPSFTYVSLSAGGIVVGGVTFCRVCEEVETTETRGHGASYLRASILEKRPDIDVQPAIAITRAVGPESYTALLDDYELAGELEQARLAQLSEALDELRYVIFARIEADIIDRGTDEDGDSTIFWTTRRVTTFFQVYDLTARVPVWSGTITEHKKKENLYVDPHDFWEFVIDLLVGLEEEYPSPPEFNKMLRKIFEGFAKHLPKFDPALGPHQSSAKHKRAFSPLADFLEMATTAMGADRFHNLCSPQKDFHSLRLTGTIVSCLQ